MTVLMVRYEVKEDRADEVEAEIVKLMAALERDRPTGIHYTMGRLADGVTFVGLLHLDEGVDNPLPGIPEARDYQQKLRDWVVGEPPVPQPLTVVGEYAGAR
jgi:hypothetical protein